MKLAFGDLQKFITQHASRTENRLADIHVVVDVFIQRVDTILGQQREVVVGTIVDARRSLDDSKRAVDASTQALERAIKESGEHRALDPADEEGAAPRPVRQAVVAITNWVWPKAMRGGREALVYAGKLVAGGVSIGAIGKVIHMLATMVHW